MIWPWQDRKRGFSRLKASTFALMFVPAIWLLYQLGTGQFGPVPIGGMTYWSGLWATALLLLALAITPALTIFRWRQLIIVRRMVGVTALAYSIAHIIIYFALRFWDFAFIANEMVTRLSLIVATLSTIGLIALIWAYHGYEPSGILGINFTLDLGISPAWQILELGLLIPVAVFTRQALRLRAAGFDARKIG